MKNKNKIQRYENYFSLTIEYDLEMLIGFSKLSDKRRKYNYLSFSKENIWKFYPMAQVDKAHIIVSEDGDIIPSAIHPDSDCIIARLDLIPKHSRFVYLFLNPTNNNINYNIAN